MSWRETLGVLEAVDNSYTHNSHNTQKVVAHVNSADIADSAYRDSEEESSKLLEAVADACRGFDVTATEVKEALAPEDMEDWRNGSISGDTLAAFARAQAQRREMNKGKVPAHYTEHAICERCGPVWLWFSGQVLGCPWCWNRSAGNPIPHPHSVQCRNCVRFERIDHPHLGRCTKSEPRVIADLWDTDRRYCSWYLPMRTRTGSV